MEESEGQQAVYHGIPISGDRNKTPDLGERGEAVASCLVGLITTSQLL